MRRYSLTAIMLVFAGCAGAPTPKGPVELSQVLGSLGLRAEMSQSYVVGEQSEAVNDNIRARNLTARTSDGRVIRIEKLDGAESAQADNFLKDKLFELDSVYEPNRDPYFSILTKQTVCPEHYKPVHETEKRGDSELLAVRLYANDRLTYGACTADQAAYRVFVGMERCPGKGGLFIFESFVPIKQTTEADAQGIRTLGCR